MAAPPATRMVETAGGALAVCEYGDPAGQPLFHLHGAPGSRYQRFFDETVYAGFRAIMFDRPGFGRSPRQPGRTLAQSAGDLLLVADALGVERFAVLGVSSGAPHALAAAGLHASRVTSCAAVVPIAPQEAAKDIDWWAGFDEEQRDNMLAALEGEAPAAARYEKEAKLWLGLLAEGKTPFPVPPPALDVALQWMPEAYAQGVAGVVDDDLAVVKPWGFELSAIAVPTAIWAGDEDDMCPPAHGRWLASRIPGAKLVEFNGGHTGFFPRFEEILDGLRDA